MQSAPFNTIEEAIDDFREGRIIIVVDDEDRENEGDFIMAAEKVTPAAINFMATHGRGLICTPMTADRLDELNLQSMVSQNTASLGTNFTVSVDAVAETTTGISASDRAQTVKVLVDKNSKPGDLARPGHIFPLRAATGGVLERRGHTEAVTDLARIAGFSSQAGILCEIMDDDGTMARLPRLFQIAEKHNLKLITIADLIEYRRRTELLIQLAEEVKFPTKFGQFTLKLFTTKIFKDELVAITKGEFTSEDETVVRLHSECLTGDVFGSSRCDCGQQLAKALEIIENEGKGVILYLRQEGRGIGLINKIKAYRLQEQGLDTVEANEELGFKADLRHYGIAAQVLFYLGIKKVKLLTNNPKKISGLQAAGVEVTERLPLEIPPTDFNQNYLRTKKEKLGHLI
ncbi:MAG: bifunctional 3,4-dihydroxy-2-butanone-4-phosphate synthase/GTP cyclohydrolase II [Calditrichaeota bacterium]|nr:MAG: bifunctional 3,4-dihydroxy-2-butanone-4-phosphate synthase/GTP cyclohydrolase II [Calditrichota bacterium]